MSLAGGCWEHSVPALHPAAPLRACNRPQWDRGRRTLLRTACLGTARALWPLGIRVAAFSRNEARDQPHPHTVQLRRRDSGIASRTQGTEPPGAQVPTAPKRVPSAGGFQGAGPTSPGLLSQRPSPGCPCSPGMLRLESKTPGLPVSHPRLVSPSCLPTLLKYIT